MLPSTKMYPASILPTTRARPFCRSMTAPSSAMMVRSLGTPVAMARSALAIKCRTSPCTGHHVPRPDDVVAVEQLTGGGVTGDVHERIALVHHLRAQPAQPVDHPVHGVLVARDQRTGQHHGVAGLQGDHRMFAIGHRDSADSGSPWEPVEISTTSWGRKLSMSRSSIKVLARTSR